MKTQKNEAQPGTFPHFMAHQDEYEFKGMRTDHDSGESYPQYDYVGGKTEEVS